MFSFYYPIICYYSWPLCNMALNLMGLLISRMFSITTQLTSVSPVSHPQILWLRRAKSIHCSTTFYIRNLSILPFWFLPMRVLEPIPHRFWGMTVVKFLESQTYTWIFDCVGISTPNATLFNGQLYNYLLYFSCSMLSRFGEKVQITFLCLESKLYFGLSLKCEKKLIYN